MGKRFVIGLLALCLFSFCVQLALYPSLPETVPIHWNAAGEVDGWAGSIGCSSTLKFQKPSRPVTIRHSFDSG